MAAGLGDVSGPGSLPTAIPGRHSPGNGLRIIIPLTNHTLAAKPVGRITLVHKGSSMSLSEVGGGGVTQTLTSCIPVPLTHLRYTWAKCTTRSRQQWITQTWVSVHTYALCNGYVLFSPSMCVHVRSGGDRQKGRAHPSLWRPAEVRHSFMPVLI